MAQAPISRRGFIIGLTITAVALIGLVAFTFIHYPGLGQGQGTGPLPSFPMWFGSSGAAIAYVVLGAYLLSLYVGLSILGTASAPPANGQPWQIGGLFGLLTSGIVFLVGIPLGFLPVISAGFAEIELLVWVGVLIAAGIVGGRASGRILGGVLAGVWCGIVLALCSSGLGLLHDLIFAPWLAQTSWAHDATCPWPDLHHVIVCETSDDLGLFASVLTALPVLGAIFGFVGGLTRDPESKQGTVAISRRAIIVPFVFLVLQGGLFIGEIIWNFW
jgi:hypothetical protein